MFGMVEVVEVVGKHKGIDPEELDVEAIGREEDLELFSNGN